MSGQPTAWRQRGASLLELMVVAVIVAVLWGALLQRLALYREHAERAAVERMVGILRAEMTVAVARARTGSAEVDFEALSRKNPMDWLREKPANYVGEYFGAPDQTVHAGTWYFDRKQHHLVYLLNFGEKFPDGSPKTLRYKVILLGLTQHFVRSTGTAASGIALEQVDG
ncbi:MAG: type II secretion system protein [Gammaproteobacteria bacterium]